jgi:hypothetical protein
MIIGTERTGTAPHRTARTLLGRNGWYCLENEVEKWWELAGWRGLKTRAVRDHFDGTFRAFGNGKPGDQWGPQAEIMRNLNLSYAIDWMGDQAESKLGERLSKGLSTFFYLWDPHSFLSMYPLNRIALPTYKDKAMFSRNMTDFPPDILEKVASRDLEKFAPKVFQMYSRFSLENNDQIEMLDNTEKLGSTMLAACAWLRSPDHITAWKYGWIPAEEFTCAPGKYMSDGVGGEPRCDPCPQGSFGTGGRSTACSSCAPGVCAALGAAAARGGRMALPMHSRNLAHQCGRSGRGHGPPQ